MAAEKTKKPHAIMISVPHQGHITPFVSLALKLASEGITVTFIHLDFVHHQLSKAGDGADFFSEARRSGLDVRYATIGDGLPMEFDRDLRFEEYWKMIIDEFPGRVDEFVGKMIGSDPGSEHFLVTDTLYAWPAVIAEKYSLVNVSFWTQTALAFALPYHWELLEQNGHFPCKDNTEEEIGYIPGVESISTKDLMSYFMESRVSSVVTEAMRVAFDAVKKADFILHNTVQELEPETLSILNDHQPTYPIGPVNFSRNLGIAKSLWSESDCTHWLESKPRKSVLYVSFGSFVHISKRVIEEIAHGLLLSGVDFVWVVRPGILGSEESRVLPEGFEDGAKDKGLIVPWCNQMRVLSSPAVGGFLTHCGWNSTLESMWCGVPVMCYPVAYDQPGNRKLVVEKWRFGINLCDGADVKREEVAEKIERFMSGALAESLRREANKVKAAVEVALEDGGSSEMNFRRFVGDLKAKLQG